MIARRRRQGFTLIELLVVIAIIGVLVGLLLPAVNAAREAGRRTQCMNNQRQLGLGMQGYINARNSFPNSVTWAGYPDITANNVAAHTATLPDNTTSVACAGLYSWVVDILPYIEQQTLFNDFNRTLPYNSTAVGTGATNNLTITSTGIGILTCPNDDTTVPDAGNLTYVVNSGFNLYWFIFNGWNSASALKEQSSATGVMNWDQLTNSSAIVGGAVAKKTGVFWPGTSSGKADWDYRTSISSIADGTSTTVMLTENTLAGATNGSPYTGGAVTNWACPQPNFVAFMASDDVCSNAASGTATTCTTATDLSPTSAGSKVVTGAGWRRANLPQTNESINFGTRAGAQEGGFPFANSLHPGGIVVTMCDGSARFIGDTIDGIVWAKIITPAGGNLPVSVTASGTVGFKQTPVSQEEIGQ